MGERAGARRAAGGQLAAGRPSATRLAYRALVERCLERARWRCERCGRDRRPLDPHHVLKRSRGGADTGNNVVILCRACHDHTDAPYCRGRLMVQPLGSGRFLFLVLQGASKWAAKVTLYRDQTPTAAWLASQGRGRP